MKRLLIFDQYMLHVFSIPLMLDTFFKPLKNEYRKQLVIFSVLMGMFLKVILLTITMCLMAIILMVQLVIVVSITVLPFLVVYLLVT